MRLVYLPNPAPGNRFPFLNYAIAGSLASKVAIIKSSHLAAQNCLSTLTGGSGCREHLSIRTTRTMCARKRRSWNDCRLSVMSAVRGGKSALFVSATDVGCRSLLRIGSRLTGHRVGAKIICHFCIPSSGHLRPIVNQAILDVAQDYAFGCPQSDRPDLTQIWAPKLQVILALTHRDAADGGRRGDSAQ